MRTAASLLASLLALTVGAACDGSDPTYMAVSNRLGDGGATIYKAWYRTTLFTEPTAPGADTPVHLVAPGAAPAYVVLAPAWDPRGDASAPGELVGIVSASPVLVKKGDTGRIAVASDVVRGVCFGAPPLSRDEYDVVRDLIFPDDTLPAYDDACGPGGPPEAPADGGANQTRAGDSGANTNPSPGDAAPG
jgi:hypothetical protein